MPQTNPVFFKPSKKVKEAIQAKLCEALGISADKLPPVTTWDVKENLKDIPCSKTRLFAQRSFTRYNHKHYHKSVIFKDYSLKNRGVLGAKPFVGYELELEGRKAPYLVGMEIEVERPSRGIDVNQLSELLTEYLPGQHYCCGDGSLRQGVEIVLAPRSASSIIQQYHRFYELFHKMRGSGHAMSERCGLHVHITRKAMSEERWLRLEEFLIKNKVFFERISRRANFSYCKFETSDYCGRYAALNRQPEQTAEFRFWAGTLDAVAFCSSLDLTFALVDFFAQTNLPLTDLAVFKKFLFKSRYKLGFKYFDRYLTEMLSQGYKFEGFSKEQQLAEKRRILEQQRADRERIRGAALEREVVAILNRSVSGLPTIFDRNNFLSVPIINIPLTVTGYNRDIREHVAVRAAMGHSYQASLYWDERVCSVRPIGVHAHRVQAFGEMRESFRFIYPRGVDVPQELVELPRVGTRGRPLAGA